jgi:hypothetical protein
MLTLSIIVSDLSHTQSLFYARAHVLVNNNRAERPCMYNNWPAKMTLATCAWGRSKWSHAWGLQNHARNRVANCKNDTKKPKWQQLLPSFFSCRGLAGSEWERHSTSSHSQCAQLLVKEIKACVPRTSSVEYGDIGENRDTVNCRERECIGA